jgi:serine-type D-Ala-D-Ala carboxypeptidase
MIRPRQRISFPTPETGMQTVAALATLLLLPAMLLAAAPDFSAADAAIEAAIADHQMPGAVLLVGKGDAIVYEKAYGNRSLKPTTQPMTADTIFDFASLTKSVAAATSVLILIDRGQIELDAPVAKYIPEFGNHGKEKITVRMLLLHHGGLIPDNPMSDYDAGPVEAWKKIFDSTPKWEPGTHFAYSDVGFLVLGELVHRVSGKPLNQFAHDEIYVPLKMNETSYLPPADWRPRIAPTEMRKGEWIIGEVHDPRAFALGGVAGHAGLFSTAQDLSRWLRMLNAGGEVEGKRILSESIVKQMLTEDALPDGTGSRGLGVDIASSYSGPRGTRFDKGTTFGHTGWTGTMYWSDPVNDVYVILLSNRVHPDGKGDLKKVRSEVSTAVAEALLGPAAQP